MSSPFDTFRKNRTYWMAGLVLVAILSFVVAPAIDSLMDTMRSGSNPGNEVVVRWADGRVTSGTVNYIRMQHSRSIRFLQALAREVIANGGMPKVPGFRYDPTNKRVEDLGLPMLDTNRAVCQTMIISERAKQLGIEFDKPVIDDFLQRFCDRKITPERFEAILKEAAGRELSFSDLYRQLGMELSALVMERVALAGVNHEGRPLVTPGSLWQNYLRLNQAARVEAYPILTRDFVKLVKEEPTKAELDALYAAGAGVFPSPNSPEAGFRRRYQASLEYVSGSWNKMLDVEKANISEEALKAEYERQVAAGQLKVPVEPPAPPASSATPATPAPAGTEPAKVPSAATPDEGQPPSPKTQSRLLGGSKLKFVAFQQTDELPPVVINPPPPVSPPDGAKGATAESTPAMRTQTFEEAKDSLARSLAMGVVRDQLQAKLAKVEAAMTAYASNLAVDQINEQNKVKADKKAVPVDLKKLAEAEGLTYGSTGLSDGFRLASTPIGRSMISNQTLANTVMFPGVELYRPVRSMFIDMGNATEPDFQEFLSWKTEQVDAYLPALNDIRDEVVEAWKNQKARVLAREEAEKLAAKVKQSGEMAWKGALDDQQQALVISPPPFTWMSAPREMFAPAQISFVQGLDTVGQEFMQRVFSSTAGDVVAVPNQGLNTYYIVRVAELTPTVEQLRENFEVSRGRASQLAFPERERMFSDWYEGIERAMNVQWVAGNEDLLN